MYTKILVDVSNLYWRCYHVSKTITHTLDDGSILTTGGIHTAIMAVQKMERELLSLNGQIFFLCDATHARLQEGDTPLRREIDPEYKANREKSPDPSFYRGLDYLILSLMSHRDNSYVVRVPGFEADDQVEPILTNFTNSEDTVLLISTDLDWARYISENVEVQRPGLNETLNVESFTEKYGFPPSYEAIRLYKTFRGDSSDNIPIGLPRIGEDLLLRMIRQYKSLDAILEDLSRIDFLNAAWKVKIIENEGRLRLNYQLVGALPVPEDLLSEYVIPASFEPKKLITIYRSLGFKVVSLDPRLLHHIESTKKSNGFFEFSTLERV